MENLTENIMHNGQLLAIIIRRDFDSPGLSFFTPDEFSQQLAYMHHPQGHLIQPHVHKTVMREVYNTQEVLFVRKGKVKVTFYDEGQRDVGARIIEAGDVLMLVRGGHGFEMLEPTQMFEVKQGPYAGVADKEKFNPRPPLSGSAEGK